MAARSGSSSDTSGDTPQTWPDKPPAAGPATGTVLALAAGLVQLTADVAGARPLAARALALKKEAEKLGREDEEAYAELLSGGSAEARERTIALPEQMAGLAASVADTAAEAAERGRGGSRYDAIAGALLAEAAAGAAVVLVEANLAGADKERLELVRRAAQRAAAAARRAERAAS